MEKVVKELKKEGITVRKFECGYVYIAVPNMTGMKRYLILNKFHGYELIAEHPGEVKYFRTISELIEYVKK